LVFSYFLNTTYNFLTNPYNEKTFILIFGITHPSVSKRSLSSKTKNITYSSTWILKNSKIDNLFLRDKIHPKI